MQSNTSRATLSAQSSGTPSASTISSSGKQQVVELSGYVIILVENVDGKIKLYGSPPDRDNLEVGDEILEVNGLTLDNISRTEIIRHIHDTNDIVLQEETEEWQMLEMLKRKKYLQRNISYAGILRF